MTDNAENITKKGKIRVVDDEGHLLFIYNPTNRCIEFRPNRGRRIDGKYKADYYYIISTDKLRSAGSRNLLTDKPIYEFMVDVIDV